MIKSSRLLAVLKGATLVGGDSNPRYVRGDVDRFGADLSMQLAVELGMEDVFDRHADAKEKNALKTGPDNPVSVTYRWRLLGIIIGSFYLTLLSFVYTTTTRTRISYERPQSSFPASGNLIWFDSPATAWADEYLPIGKMPQ